MRITRNRQRDLHGPRKLAPPVTDTSADHQARLAHRLTPRDRWILAMLHEHHCLTTEHLTALAFPSGKTARERLRELTAWGVVARFQPFITKGTLPFHYVVGPTGAAILAATYGITTKQLPYRAGHTAAVAHSQQLAHTVATNDFYTALATTKGPGRLIIWWSETRCTKLFGDKVRPDGYGRYLASNADTDTPGEPSTEIEFFTETDCGTESQQKVARKLHGYAALAEASGITTPVLFWFPSAAREANARAELAGTLATFPAPGLLPIATAAITPAPECGPAGQVWLPLDNPGSERITLPGLTHHWPGISVASTGPNEPAGDGIPAPKPTPPQQY